MHHRDCNRLSLMIREDGQLHAKDDGSKRARDKMNFDTVPHGLEFIKQLNPVAFQFKFARDSSIPNGPVRYGFKAQDILELEGEDNAVIIDNDDPDKLRYNGEALVPVLVNAIKEQQTIIDTLIARLDAAGI